MEYTGYELLWLFLIYSFLGWCAEVSMAALPLFGQMVRIL